MAVDLHIHSSASDGTVPPRDIPRIAVAAQLSAVALTDHDTTSGITDFLACQQDFPELELIPGVELSSQLGARELHIVGLFIDHTNSELQDFMSAMRRGRVKRAHDMLQKLHTLGYEISWDELKAVGMTDDVPGRPHFARVLCQKYNFPDTQSVFERLLKRGAPGFVPRELPTPEAAIRVIKHAGGAAVWAHPLSARHNENNFIRRLLPVLKNSGLDAIEGYYSEYNPTRTANALRLAGEFALAVSGGSDFHGELYPDIQLGRGRGELMVPDSVLDDLRRTLRPKVLLV